MKKILLMFFISSLISSLMFGQGLTGLAPSSTYKDLLYMNHANTGIDATLRYVYDGKGTASALQVSTTSIGFPSPFTLGLTSVTATGAEFNYLVGVTSPIQTQLNIKAPLASPTFTGTVTIPSPFTLGATSVTTTPQQFNYLNGATGTTGTGNLVFSNAPTFTGTLSASNITSSASGVARVAIQSTTSLSRIALNYAGADQWYIDNRNDFSNSLIISDASVFRFILAQGGALTLGSTAGTGTGAFYAGSYYTGTTAGYLSSALGSISATIGTVGTTALYLRTLTINGVTIHVVTSD